eukprot:scaffold16568_cov36-Phaeocystis_antarctica.AAC.1
METDGITVIRQLTAERRKVPRLPPLSPFDLQPPNKVATEDRPQTEVKQWHCDRLACKVQRGLRQSSMCPCP